MATKKLDSNRINSDIPSEGCSSWRDEIDTTSPFKSVKEAVNLFGGMGFWKPFSHNISKDILKVEEHAAKLQNDIMIKERETLEILKELETTKYLVQQLKLNLQKEESTSLEPNSSKIEIGGLDFSPFKAPAFILLELQRAKLNLTRTTNDIADIRAAVVFYNWEIDKQKMSLEQTRQRLSSNISKITCLEEELNKTKHKLELVKDTEITRELQNLSFGTQQFEKSGESAGSISQVLREIMSEIEETKTRIKAAQIRLVAAEKMKQAAKASEAVALAEIKALSNNKTNSFAAADAHRKSEDVTTLTFKEYSSVISETRVAEQACNSSFTDVMVQVDEATVLQSQILKTVEAATNEVQISKRALEEALSRVEVANGGKLAVEEAVGKWRSEHIGERRRSVHNSTKFKNSHPLLNRRDSHRLQVNDVDHELQPPTLEKSMDRLISKPNIVYPRSGKKDGKENIRKKFSFSRISLIFTKHSNRKKKLNAFSMCRSS